eukprot:75546_1
MSIDSIKHNISGVDSDTFTMVFLDFDDTLIPSKLYRLFANNLSIDIFELFSESKIIKLQNQIIESIEHIRYQYNNNNQLVKFCVVSNASQKWLDYMFNGSISHCISSRIPILNNYFKHNNISVLSAAVKSYKYLQQQFGYTKANKLFSNSESKSNKWIWKYTTFAKIISGMQKQLNKKCTQIISIGDGSDEEKALKQYSNTHKINSLHIKCIRSPTIIQLQRQWIYLKSIYTFHDPTKKNVSGYKFIVFDLENITELSNDNNNQLTGKKNQLPAIKQYFQIWMDNLKNISNGEKKIAMECVCQSIHKKMYSMNNEKEVSRMFKLILIKAICKNTEFNAFFNAYYRKIQQHYMEIDRINKKKRLSVKCSS